MERCRFLGMGFLMLLAGGCAGRQKPAAGVTQAKPSSTTQKVMEPKWEASSTPAELLAQKTSAYANTVQSGTPGDTPIASFAPPETNSATLTDRKTHHRHEDLIATGTASLPADASPIVQPAASALINPPALSRHDDPYNGPKIMPESVDFGLSPQASKDDLGNRLRKRTRENPHDIADQLDLQLYGMLNDDPSPELASVTELPNDDRELVSALIDGLSNFRSTVREDSNMLPSKKVKPLLEMADRLRSQADLTVSTVALCRRVDGFGKYDPISPVRFRAMQDSKAIVYCEVQNFTPRQDGPIWRTKLTEQVTLYSDMGVLAWSDDKREVSDECRNRRQDFFAYNIVDLPPTLTVGRYVLKVSIEDKNADRVAEATVPLEIVGK